MDTPAANLCPRCGAAFHCGIAGPGPCPCSGVRLAAETLALLRRDHASCLCLDCLQALAGPADAPASPAGPPLVRNRAA